MAVTKLDVQAVKDLMAKSPGMSYVDAARQVRGTPAPTTTPTTQKLTEQEVRQGMIGLSVPERQKMRANLKPVTEPNKTVVTPAFTPTVNTIDNKQELLQSTKGLTLDQRRAVMQNQAASTPSLPDLTPPTQTPTPTPVQKAPDPVTPPAPVTPTATQEVPEATPTPKVEPIVDRTSQIQTNLATGYNTDQKTILEKQPTINSFYNTLVTGGSVTTEQKNNPSYRVANVRYQKVKMYDGMSQAELANSLKSGDIIEGSQEWEDLKAMNPKLAKDGLNLFKVNGGKTNIFTKNEDGTITNNLEMNATKTWEQTSKDLFKVQTLEEIRNEIQTEDFKVAQAQANEYAMQLNELQDAIDAIDSDVDKEFAKTGATKSRIALEKADRNDALGREYDSVNRKYLTQFNIANQILTQNTANVVTRNQQQQKQNEALFGIYQQQMQNENALALDQAKFEQGLAQQAQLAKDPVTGVKSILATYAQMGITPMRSEAQIIADIEKQVAQGVPVEQALTDLNKAFQSKPEYKQYMDYKKAQMTPAATTPEVKNFGTSDRPDYRQYNTSTGQWETVTQGGYIDVPRTGNNVGQDTNNPGNIMGDTEAQRNLATSYGAVGFYKSPNGRTYAVFPDMQTGVNASLADLQSKLSGGSSWATPDTTLAKFASGWVSGPNAPMNQNAVNNYVKLTGYSANTKIKDIPIDILAKAIFANEGVDISKSATISPTTQQSTQQYQDISEINLPDKATEYSKKSFGFASRMTQAEKALQNMEDKYMDSWTATEYFAPRGEWVPNFLKTTDRQQYEQSQRNFINAVLRQESGAVISDQEFDNARKQYFPAPGDSKKVIEQKRQNRYTATLSMFNSSGKTDKGESIKDIFISLKGQQPQVQTTYPTQTNTGAGTNTVTGKTTYTW